MNSPTNLGYRTDFIFYRRDGIVEEFDDYWIVRTPSNPTFWFGNLVLFKRAPRADDLAPFLAIHKREFGGALNHHVFGWDEERERDISAFLAAGFQTSHGIALTMSTYDGGAAINPALSVRMIRSSSEWQQVADLQILVDRVDFKYAEDGGEFRRVQVDSSRRMVADKRGHWWGAFIDEELVGSMGLFFDDPGEIGRFQYVTTRPDHRRQRICTTLLHHSVRHAFETVGAQHVVICTGAEDDNPAIPTYKNFGFQLTAPNYALKRV
jgi:ribosomal protein S18 acetylase RimI-like enzyme